MKNNWGHGCTLICVAWYFCLFVCATEVVKMCNEEWDECDWTIGP